MASAYLQKHKQHKPHTLTRQVIQESKMHNFANHNNGDRARLNEHDRPHIRAIETDIFHQVHGHKIGRSVPPRSRELVKQLYQNSPEMHPRTPANFTDYASHAVYKPINYMPLPSCLQTMSRK